MIKKVLAFGSDFSTEQVDDNANKYNLVGHYSRSSFASMGSNPIHQKPNIDVLNTAQKRSLKRDFSKEFMTVISNLGFHALLIDFIDERFNLLENQGSVITRTAEFCSSGTVLKGYKLVKLHSDDYFELWKKGWAKFIEQMRKKKLLDRVRLNKVFWIENRTKCYSDAQYKIEEVQKQNEFLSKLYAEAEKDLEDYQVYSYPSSLFLYSEASVKSYSPLSYSMKVYAYGRKYFLNDEHLSLLISSLSNNKLTPKPSLMKILSKLIFQDIPLFLLTKNARPKLKVAEVSSIKNFVEDGLFIEGRNTLTLSSGLSVDFLYWEPENLSANNNKLLVCFNAAVGQRDVKSAPFFSGVGLAADLGIPVICIADPLVSDNRELGLAWYTGGEESNSLQLLIAELLNQIYGHYQYEMIICGGSGGGFASLVQASLITVPATVVVWNSQSSILKYLDEPVERYVRTAFKNFMSKADFTLLQVLEWFGIKHEIKSLQISKQVKLIYLQNQSDSHTQIHAIPFMKGEKWKRVRNATFSNDCGNRIVYFGDWGRGHVTPTRGILSFIFDGVINNHDLLSLCYRLDAGELKCAKSPPYFSLFAFSDDISIDLLTDVVGEKINATVQVIGAADEVQYLSYSFRLHNGDDILKARDYTKDRSISFLTPKNKENLKVALRVQDKYGTILRKYKEINI